MTFYYSWNNRAKHQTRCNDQRLILKYLLLAGQVTWFILHKQFKVVAFHQFSGAVHYLSC